MCFSFLESSIVKVPENPSVTPTTVPVCSISSPSVTSLATSVVTTIASPRISTTTVLSNSALKTKSMMAALTGGSQEQIVEKAKQVRNFEMTI